MIMKKDNTKEILKYSGNTTVIGGGIMTLIGLLSKNKQLSQLGIGIAATGIGLHTANHFVKHQNIFFNKDLNVIAEENERTNKRYIILDDNETILVQKNASINKKSLKSLIEFDYSVLKTMYDSVQYVIKNKFYERGGWAGYTKKGFKIFQFHGTKATVENDIFKAAETIFPNRHDYFETDRDLKFEWHVHYTDGYLYLEKTKELIYVTRNDKKFYQGLDTPSSNDYQASITYKGSYYSMVFAPRVNLIYLYQWHEGVEWIELYKQGKNCNLAIFKMNEFFEQLL